MCQIFLYIMKYITRGDKIRQSVSHRQTHRLPDADILLRIDCSVQYTRIISIGEHAHVVDCFRTAYVLLFKNQQC